MSRLNYTKTIIGMQLNRKQWQRTAIPVRYYFDTYFEFLSYNILRCKFLASFVILIRFCSNRKFPQGHRQSKSRSNLWKIN